MNALTESLELVATAIKKAEPKPVGRDDDNVKWTMFCSIGNCMNDLEETGGMRVTYKSNGKLCHDYICHDCYPEYMKETKINHPEAKAEEYK